MDLFRKLFSPKGMIKKSIINNSFVLYGLFILSCILCLTWIQLGQFTRLVVFAIAAYITTHFSKNFVVIMTIGLAATFLASFMERSREGFEEGMDGEKKEMKEGMNDGEKKEKKEGMDGEAKGAKKEVKEGEKEERKEAKAEKEKPDEKASSLLNNIRSSGMQLKDLTSNIKSQLAQLVPDMKRAEGLVTQIKKDKEEVDALQSE